MSWRPSPLRSPTMTLAGSVPAGIRVGLRNVSALPQRAVGGVKDRKKSAARTRGKRMNWPSWDGPRISRGQSGFSNTFEGVFRCQICCGFLMKPGLGPPEGSAHGEADGELEVGGVRSEAYAEAEIDHLAGRVHIGSADSQGPFDQVGGEDLRSVPVWSPA